MSNTSKRTFCNPLDLPYQYRRIAKGREGADPFIIIFKDKYYLFFSNAVGYFVSDDLAEWKHIKVDMAKYPIFDKYAPGACVIGDTLYLIFFGGGIISSSNPDDPDSWVDVGFPRGFSDPSLFYEDGYVYVCDGCDPEKPLYLWKLDPNDGMKIVEGPVEVYQQDKINHGFERKGQNNDRIDEETWLEGAWLHKYDGKYYLTFAVPGTEYWTYADGCCVADNPMGPYTLCDNSPVAFKSTGFVRGAGHGCMFEDKARRWWRVATTSVNVNHGLERRIALYPVKHADDRRLYTNTFRTDYPMPYPTDNPTPFETPDIGWELLSYGKATEASSCRDSKHTPDHICDENPSTLWCAQSGNAGEWVKMDLGNIYSVRAVQVNFGDLDQIEAQGDSYGAYKYTVDVSEDGISYATLIDMRENEAVNSHPYFPLDDVTRFRYIRLTSFGDAPAEGKLAVSGIRVFGDAYGDAPKRSPKFTAVRNADDPCIVNVSWNKVDGAQGYCVRLGVDPNEMHIHYTVYGNCDAVVGCLIGGVKYYLTVDSFNEGGITRGHEILEIE